MEIETQAPKINVGGYYLVHVGMENGAPIIGKFMPLVAGSKKYQFKHFRSTYNVRVADIGHRVYREATAAEVQEHESWSKKSGVQVCHLTPEDKGGKT